MKILLIVDSIRQGYDKYVKQAFEGVAEVYCPADNCRFAAYILRHLIDRKNQLLYGDDVDLRMLDGENHTPITVYKHCIERVCCIIKKLFPNAKMIFATSTPVQEELFKEYKRLNRDTGMYNAAAEELMHELGVEGVEILADACIKDMGL